MGLQVPFALYLLVFFFCRYCNYLFRVTQTNKVVKTKQTKHKGPPKVSVFTGCLS